MNRINGVGTTTRRMSHDKAFIAVGTVHGVGSGGTVFVAVLGSTAGLTGVVICNVVAVGLIVVFVEIFVNGWARVIVVAVAIVAPIAVTVDVAPVVVIPTGGEFKAKGCDVC
jgi:hypothetical protein